MVGFVPIEVGGFLRKDHWRIAIARFQEAVFGEILDIKIRIEKVISFDKFKMDSDIVCRRFSLILQVIVPSETAPKTGNIVKMTPYLSLQGNPRPLLVTHDLVCGVGSFNCVTCHPNRSPNQIETSTRDNLACNAGKGHDLGPKSHRHQRIEIALGAGMILRGVYFILYAFRKGRAIRISAGRIDTVFGVLNVMLGNLLAAYAFFSL